ncbi:DeoR/GlpR family DNA-binding transcription regulator [Fodinicurvata sp. EGI_FJ10296]|uniref:DeoR/GlpR family DNA-binding transcription regulator n=1 Tax=Fodinicurvata sp. EGI_FJ10296 TaxID=3231908 RepID=UPI0034546039
MAQIFRHQEILKLAREQGNVVVEDLAAHFGVALQTIRRDLTELCDAGKLTRVYGGAILASGVSNIGYEDRRVLHAREKESIAARVAAEIPDAASLFLNIGTTTEAVARALLNHRNLLVVTNNLNVANILASNETAEVIVAGGVLRRADAGLVGDVTLEIVQHFKVDIAVIGTSALDEEGDLLDFDFREVRVSQAIIRQARRTFLAADTSKFARTAPVRIASLADVDLFVTDAPPPVPVVERCREWGTRIEISDAAREASPDGAATAESA